MRGILSSRAASVFFAALFAAGGAAANPAGVPVSELPPLSCTTVPTYDGFFTITAITSDGTPTGTYPIPATCSTASGPVPCSDYGYRISSTTMTVDRAAFSVSATQDLNPRTTTPGPLTGSVTVFPPGQGAGGYEESRGFLADALHEYVVRFNNSYQPVVEAHIFITGQSSARIGTVLLRTGSKNSQRCLIATPGIAPTNVFQPLYTTQNALVSGGRCSVTKFFQDNLLVDVQVDNTATNAANGCIRGTPDKVLVGTEELRNNIGEHGITFGSGTSTCYGPPTPRKPICVCTRSPCP
jgi:hypothetical protein